MNKYRLLSKKGEGTFSEVVKAQSIKTGKYVAIKRMKNTFDSLDQVNNLREIQALRRLSPHPNIVRLIEVIYDRPTGRLSLVFELMEQNIYELIRGRRTALAENKVKVYMYHLLRSMDHMHRNGIFHRDIKPENILLGPEEGSLKLADFGSCRGINTKQPYTEYISTRWYRAPECLLTDGYYTHKMDMWGIGCVFFEVLSLFPLFPGSNEVDQLTKIHNVLGTPSQEYLGGIKNKSKHISFNFPRKTGCGLTKLLPNVSSDCIELLTHLLAYDPADRWSARQSLRHPYFRALREADKTAARLRAKAVSPARDGPVTKAVSPPDHNRKSHRHASKTAAVDASAATVKRQSSGSFLPTLARANSSVTLTTAADSGPGAGHAAARASTNAAASSSNMKKASVYHNAGTGGALNDGASKYVMYKVGSDSNAGARLPRTTLRYGGAPSSTTQQQQQQQQQQRSSHQHGHHHGSGSTAYVQSSGAGSDTRHHRQSHRTAGSHASHHRSSHRQHAGGQPRRRAYEEQKRSSTHLPSMPGLGKRSSVTGAGAAITGTGAAKQFGVSANDATHGHKMLGSGTTSLARDGPGVRSDMLKKYQRMLEMQERHQRKPRVPGGGGMDASVPRYVSPYSQKYMSSQRGAAPTQGRWLPNIA